MAFAAGRVGLSAVSRTAIALCASLILSAVPAASAVDHRFEIRSAYVELRDGVYLLNARLDFTLPVGAQEAIRDGVLLTLDLEIVVDHRRRLWPDDTVAMLEQRYEVGFHALSERYLVRNLNSGELTSFPTLESAIDSLSLIADLPILDRSLVDPQLNYEVNLRATLDVRSMPEALRFLLFWVDSFKQSTDWYAWPLSL
jgi:hypothetical protein